MAYQSRRGIFTGSIYLKAWDGTGDEEHLFQYTPGASLQPADWSADGSFLTFQDGCWGVLYVVPVSGDEEALEREAMEWLRDEYSVAQARFWGLYTKVTIGPERPYVAALVCWSAFRLLGAHVGGGTQQRADTGHGRRRGDRRGLRHAG